MSAAPSPAPSSPTTVVLLHGLGRSPLAMKPLAWRLGRAGLATINLGYTGARRPVAETAADLAARLDAALEGVTGSVHFVTHSMGGILARAYLSSRARPGTRLVQLAPPNQGARIAEALRGVALARGVLGVALDDLGVEAERGLRCGVPLLVDQGQVEVGVIAGGRGGPRGYGPWLPEDNDMVVCVRETFLPGARDWILVPHVHTFMMNARAVHENVLAFLSAGRFLPAATRITRSDDGLVRVDSPP